MIPRLTGMNQRVYPQHELKCSKCGAPVIRNRQKKQATCYPCKVINLKAYAKKYHKEHPRNQ